MSTVDALWVGPQGYDLPHHTRVDDNGNAVYSVPEGEAHASDNWKVLEPPAPAKPKSKEKGE